MNPTFAFVELNPGSILLLLILGALLFGKQLPSVGNWLGKTLRSVQDGMSGIERDVTPTTAPQRDPATLESPRPPQRIVAQTPKFDDTTTTTPNNGAPTT